MWKQEYPQVIAAHSTMSNVEHFEKTNKKKTKTICHDYKLQTSSCTRERFCVISQSYAKNIYVVCLSVRNFSDNLF